MTQEMIIVLAALIVAIILFVTELLRADIVAILILACLVLSGVLTPEEGLSGFSNSATATVAAMFVLSAGVERTGVLIPLAKRMQSAFKRSFWLGFMLMIFVAGFFSAFVNNTPVVALMIPVIISSASKSGISPSKVLIPLSFVSMFGGVCTLIGTSTNILVSDISDKSGYGPLGMFEMTSLGLIFFGAGIIYMIFIGLKLLPDYGKITDLDKEFNLSKYLTNIVLLKESLKKAKKLRDLSFLKEENVEVVQLRRGKNRYYLPRKDFELMENDVLKLKCDVDKIKQLKTKIGIEVRPLLSLEVEEHGQEEIKYVEAIISPGSALVGQKLKNIDFRGKYNAALLGIREREGLFSKLMRQEKAVSGDTLLLAVSKKELNTFNENNEDFILISQPDFSQPESKKGFLTIGIVLTVILLASFNVLPILISAILGCLLLLITRCIEAEQAYKAVDWKVIFLLAGAMSFGVALEKTGLAALTGQGVISISGTYGPVIMLSIIYLLTSLLTELISNNATVVLLAPIVIAMAVSLGISPKPFLIAITFAASSSFMTPIGYQTNTMVYAAGNYKFKDFFKVGIWLNLLFWMLATLFIPYFFPF